MFDKLLDMLAGCWQLIVPFHVVRVFEHGAQLRLGKYYATREPGLWFKWPFIDEITNHVTVETTIRLPPQSITTKDGVSIVLEAIVKYEITDVEKYTRTICDQHDVLVDSTLGLNRKVIKTLTWDELVAADVEPGKDEARTLPPEEQVVKMMRSKTTRYGFRVIEVTFATLAKMRSIRLVSAVAKDVDN